MHDDLDPDLPHDLDEWLHEPLLTPPPDFTSTVMRRIRQEPARVPRAGWRDIAQWIALLVGGMFGLAELGTFAFGMWAATNAG